MSSNREIKGRTYSVLGIALFGVLGLGAKGCDRAVVGDDGQCVDCAGQAGASSGGSENAGTGGTDSGGTGTAGTPSAGRGGSSGTAGRNGSAGTTAVGGRGGSGGSGPGSTVCGGLADQGCPDEQFCDYPPDALCGAADGTGVCQPMPEVCTDQYDPVCGCDGETYANACEAAGAGVSISSDGECEEPVGVACGGFAGDTCADDEYCDFPLAAICGRADGSGVCALLPEACDANYAPVCACDGETYGNECEAALAGQGVLSEGECEEPTGGVCGGLRGAECAAGTFCNFTIDAQCGAADQTGTCESIPDGCTLQIDLVCGCDDKTYSNACEAAMAGVSVAALGACRGDPGEVCGGIAALPCPEDLYCFYPIEAMCGDGDMTGTCAGKPELCAAVVDPVCGCDGETYSSDCIAAAAGMSVRSSDGGCPE